MISETKNIDCMAAMAEFPDNYFDLAIVDPPYGLGDRLRPGSGKLKNTKAFVLYENSTRWDVAPDSAYFKELFRVSKNQIICGANYFMENLHSSRGIICWDKKQAMPSFSSWEFLWSSFDKPAKIFCAESTDKDRFHPTQKPVSLYKWLLKNYSRAGDKILDTHLGSGSSRIAAYDMGFDFWGFELDPKYFETQEERFKNHKNAPGLFASDEMYKFEQTEIF